jgi:hypothetical protein
MKLEKIRPSGFLGVALKEVFLVQEVAEDHTSW